MQPQHLPGADVDSNKQVIHSRQDGAGTELRYAGLLVPSCSSLGTSSCLSGPDARGSKQGGSAGTAQPVQSKTSSCLRLGFAGSFTAWDSAVLSGWHTLSAVPTSGVEKLNALFPV